jgi:hypothetical protein
MRASDQPRKYSGWGDASWATEDDDLVAYSEGMALGNETIETSHAGTT